MIDASTQDAKVESILYQNDKPAGKAPIGNAVEGRANSLSCSLPANGMTQKAQRRRKRRLRKQRGYQAAYRERKRDAEDEAMRTAPDVFDEMHRLEELTGEARRSAGEAGLSVPEWLARMPAEERQGWNGIEEWLGIGERVQREGRERDAWKDRLRLAMNQRGIQAYPYWFLVYAEHELRVQGIGLAEQRAVDYTLDVLMPRGPMNDERGWYEMVHG